MIPWSVIETPLCQQTCKREFGFGDGTSLTTVEFVDISGIGTSVAMGIAPSIDDNQIELVD